MLCLILLHHRSPLRYCMNAFMQSYAILATTQMHNPCLLYQVSHAEYIECSPCVILSFAGIIAPVHGFFYAPDSLPNQEW